MELVEEQSPARWRRLCNCSVGHFSGGGSVLSLSVFCQQGNGITRFNEEDIFMIVYVGFLCGLGFFGASFLKLSSVFSYYQLCLISGPSFL